MYDLQLGTSVNAGDGFTETLGELKENGFYSFDYDLCAFWREEEKEKQLFLGIESELDVAATTGLKLNAVHIPFGPRWDFSDLDEAKRADAVLRAINLIKRIDPYKPFGYVVHGSFEPIADGDRNAKIAALVRSLGELKAATNSAICVEDLPRTCLGNTAAELSAIVAAADVKVCLDVNHFLKEKPEEAIPVLGKRIATTHVSDYDFIDERHLLPKRGKIEWNAVIAALEKVGYAGAFNYESEGTPAEKAKNHKELFSDYNAKTL